MVLKRVNINHGIMMMYIKMLCTEIRQPRSCYNQRPVALYHLKLL